MKSEENALTHDELPLNQFEFEDIGYVHKLRFVHYYDNFKIIFSEYILNTSMYALLVLNSIIASE